MDIDEFKAKLECFEAKIILNSKRVREELKGQNRFDNLSPKELKELKRLKKS